METRLEREIGEKRRSWTAARTGPLSLTLISIYTGERAMMEDDEASPEVDAEISGDAPVVISQRFALKQGNAPVTKILTTKADPQTSL